MKATVQTGRQNAFIGRTLFVGLLDSKGGGPVARESTRKQFHGQPARSSGPGDAADPGVPRSSLRKDNLSLPVNGSNRLRTQRCTSQKPNVSKVLT
jgi:hypothetical protein